MHLLLSWMLSRVLRLLLAWCRSMMLRLPLVLGMMLPELLSISLRLALLLPLVLCAVGIVDLLLLRRRWCVRILRVLGGLHTDSQAE